MSGIPRVLIGEINGIELEFNSEHKFDTLDSLYPEGSVKYTFDGEELLTDAVVYRSATQTVANRIADITVTYNGDEQPTTEVWKYYNNTDGTLLLKTVTTTYTWSGDLPTSSETVYS